MHDQLLRPVGIKACWWPRCCAATGPPRAVDRPRRGVCWSPAPAPGPTRAATTVIEDTLSITMTGNVPRSGAHGALPETRARHLPVMLTAPRGRRLVHGHRRHCVAEGICGTIKECRRLTECQTYLMPCREAEQPSMNTPHWPRSSRALGEKRRLLRFCGCTLLHSYAMRILPDSRRVG